MTTDNKAYQELVKQIDAAVFKDICILLDNVMSEMTVSEAYEFWTELSTHMEFRYNEIKDDRWSG